MVDTRFAAKMPSWQKLLILLVIAVVAVVAWMVVVSTQLGIEVLGLFIQIAGVLLLSLGLVRTNDDVLFLAEHPKHKKHDDIITHLATERFQIMLGLFLLVLGLLLQIFGAVF